MMCMRAPFTDETMKGKITILIRRSGLQRSVWYDADRNVKQKFKLYLSYPPDGSLQRSVWYDADGNLKQKFKLYLSYPPDCGFKLSSVIKTPALRRAQFI